jgi:hypothetical protein
MMNERIRFAVEIIGISAVVISLVFVGYELKLTREMNLAEMHFNRIALEHSRYLASMQSEAELGTWSKQHSPIGNWDTGDLTEFEVAAAEMAAMALWFEYQAEFRLIELGFETRDLNALKTDIAAISIDMPQMVAVYKQWWYYPGEDNTFTDSVNEILRNIGIDIDSSNSLCRQSGVC